jgi:hypothetical protein
VQDVEFLSSLIIAALASPYPGFYHIISWAISSIGTRNVCAMKAVTLCSDTVIVKSPQKDEAKLGVHSRHEALQVADERHLI